MKGRFSLNLRNLGIITLAILVLTTSLPLQVFAADVGGTATKLNPPTGIESVIGDEAVTLMWNAVDGAISYNVYYSEAGGSITESLKTSGTNAVIDGLTNGQEYEFKISTVGEAGEGELSNTIPATPEAPNPPSAPIIDQAVAGDSSIVVTWQRLTDSSVAGYFVYYKEQGHADYIQVDAGMENSYTINGLTNGMNYDVTVSAYDDSAEPVESDKSDVLTAAPQAGLVTAASQSVEQNTDVQATVVSTIQGLTATPGDKKVDLAWTGLTGTTIYKIRYATTSSSLPTDNAVIKTTAAGAISYSVTGLTNGTKYYFSIEDSTDPSTRSTNEVSAIPQTDPTITFTAPALDNALKYYTKDTGEVTIQGSCENTSLLTDNGGTPTTLNLSKDRRAHV
jgi:fibronectin type 3 domain-containing protein